MNAFLSWFWIVLLCAAPILLLRRGGSRRGGSGDGSGAWAGFDGGSGSSCDGDGG